MLLPVTIAMSTIGLYSMAATLLWGRLLFGIDVHIVHPLALLPSAIVGDGRLDRACSGSCSRSSFVRYRTAWALGNLFEYPVWLICGFLVPLSLFPGWVRPISWVLAPTWGMNAIRESALGGLAAPRPRPLRRRSASRYTRARRRSSSDACSARRARRATLSLT